MNEGDPTKRTLAAQLETTNKRIAKTRETIASLNSTIQKLSSTLTRKLEVRDRLENNALPVLENDAADLEEKINTEPITEPIPVTTEVNEIIIYPNGPITGVETSIMLAAIAEAYLRETNKETIPVNPEFFQIFANCYGPLSSFPLRLSIDKYRKAVSQIAKKFSQRTEDTQSIKEEDSESAKETIGWININVKSPLEFYEAVSGRLEEDLPVLKIIDVRKHFVLQLQKGLSKHNSLSSQDHSLPDKTVKERPVAVRESSLLGGFNEEEERAKLKDLVFAFDLDRIDDKLKRVLTIAYRQAEIDGVPIQRRRVPELILSLYDLRSLYETRKHLSYQQRRWALITIVSLIREKKRIERR